MVFSNVGVSGSLINLFVVSSDALEESFLVVFGLDEIEWHGFVRRMIFPEKGVTVDFAFFFQILIHKCKCLQVYLLSPFGMLAT